MEHPQITTPPLMKTGMLIRKPVQEVFEAFIDPEVTTKFWFTRSSGRLAQGSQVQWDWEMYGISIPVTVKEFDPERRLLIDWCDPPTQVEWVFTPRPDGTTFVRITNSGFAGEADEVVSQAIDSAGGFSFVLAGLKALLEHDVELNLIADHAPDAHKKAGA